jgi:formylglycine-generating enzyme required for sulfatase activity
LPTEAEWEYAARGPDGPNYPWGNETPTCDKANYWGKDDGCVGDTTAIGSYPDGASWCGAQDMAGNVWEWVADCYDGDYYGRSPSRNPTGPSSGNYKVLRGGGWGNGQRFVRTAYRYNLTPGYRYSDVGFRCVAPPGD